MTTQEFSKTLMTTLTQRMTERLIELAEASIDAGVEEYIEKGYITLDFKGEFDSSTDLNEADKMRQDLLTKGLGYYEFRCISDTSWGQMRNHLEKSGWKVEWLKVDGNDQRIVKMPSKLIDEQ